jgi:putative membrane protein
MNSVSGFIPNVLHWVVSAFSLLLTAYLIRGFQVGSFTYALLAAVVIGFANVIIRPVLLFLTLPINILTLGLFTFVVNGAVLKICASILPGFEIQTWGAAILGAIILTIVSWILHSVFI